MKTFDLTFPEPLNEIILSPGKETIIQGISSINLFFGKNNSRKSRLIRTFLKTEIFRLTQTGFLTKYNELRILWKTTHEKIKKTPAFDLHFENSLWNAGHHTILKKHLDYEVYLNEIKQFTNGSLEFNPQHISNQLDTIERIIPTINPETSRKIKEIIKALCDLMDIQCRYITMVREVSMESGLAKKIENIFPDIIATGKLISALNELSFEDRVPKKVFIPVLRNASDLFGTNSDRSKIFTNFLEEKYNIRKNSHLEIHDGTNLYLEILKMRNAEKRQRENIERFEEFISNTFFGGLEVEIVADYDLKSIRLSIPDQEDRLLHDIGDGLQNLLILMYPIFMAEKETWLFIEEPENNIHPGLQNIFIRTLLSNSAITNKNLKFFISTHSNHILDVGAESSTVSFFKLRNSGERSELINLLGPDHNVLFELGVKNTSILTSNCSIWIEGVSDRRIIQGLIKKYLEAHPNLLLIEGYHYNFFEYSGSNLIHYNFEEDKNYKEQISALLLSNRIFLLADLDSDKEDKHKFYKSLNASTRFEYQTTIGREIENIIPPKLILSYLNSLKIPQNKLTQVDIQFEDFKDIGLGEYLDSLSLRKQKFSHCDSQTGTLSGYHKAKLSKFVYDKCLNSSDVKWSEIAENKAAQEITTNLYNFIVAANKL